MKTAKIIVISASVVGAVLLIGASVMLYRGVARFNTAQDSLGELKGRLERFYKASTFPSDKNIKVELDNARQADEWFNDLMAKLASGNVTSTRRSPSYFITIGNQVRRTLENEARKSGTTLPDPNVFAFGFEAYYTGADGALPNSDDVPRLLEQLIVIKKISSILFDSGVKELFSVKRQVFEKTGSTSESADVSRRGNRNHRRGVNRTAHKTSKAANLSDLGIIKKGELYAKMHYEFDFKAKEKSLIEIMNLFSTSKMFIVVTSLTIKKKTPELVPPVPVVVDEDSSAGDDILGFGSARKKPKKEKVQPRLGPNYPVCGIKQEIPMEIHLELDVYKFKEADSDTGH